MDIEGKIRSRIESILSNDLKNSAEIQRMAISEEPLEIDPFEEDRNLYQRIINNYRAAVSEVNGLLEHNINLLSGLSRIIENIKGRTSLQEIGIHTVENLLEEFGAEYAALVLFSPGDAKEPHLCLEGVREDRAFFRIPSGNNLLGLPILNHITERIRAENADFLNLGDVYRQTVFNSVDFPSVVRSMICLPVRLDGNLLGLLILSHSLPNFFSDNHVRILKILSNVLAHLSMFIDAGIPAAYASGEAPVSPKADEGDLLSIVLLEFEKADFYGRVVRLSLESLRAIRSRLRLILAPGESIAFYEERILLVLLPGVASAGLPVRIKALQDAFSHWKSGRGDRAADIRMNIGFSTCEGEQDLSRALEVASHLWNSPVAEAAERA